MPILKPSRSPAFPSAATTPSPSPGQARQPPGGAAPAAAEPVIRPHRPALGRQGRRAPPGREAAACRPWWRAEMYQMEHDRAVREFEMRSFYERGASSQSSLLGSLLLGLMLAAVGAAAWWSFKLLRWGFGHLLRLVGWGGVATLAAVALAGGYAWVHFFS